MYLGGNSASTLSVNHEFADPDQLPDAALNSSVPYSCFLRDGCDGWPSELGTVVSVLHDDREYVPRRALRLECARTAFRAWKPISPTSWSAAPGLRDR